MNSERITLLTGCILEEEEPLTLGELCRACEVPAEHIIALVEEGILDPVGPEAGRWRFTGPSLQRARMAMRLQHDLGVNVAGVALVLDLIEEVEKLRSQLTRFP